MRNSALVDVVTVDDSTRERARGEEKRCFGNARVDERPFSGRRPARCAESSSRAELATAICALEAFDVVPRGETSATVEGRRRALGCGSYRRAVCAVFPRTDLMVFENIEMRNPGFLLEDARHGYIQYIRYLFRACVERLRV